MSKLEESADDKFNVAEMKISHYDRIENILGKEENAGYQHFLFPTVFSKAFVSRVVKSWDCMVKTNCIMV